MSKENIQPVEQPEYHAPVIPEIMEPTPTVDSSPVSRLMSRRSFLRGVAALGGVAVVGDIFNSNRSVNADAQSEGPLHAVRVPEVSNDIESQATVDLKALLERSLVNSLSELEANPQDIRDITYTTDTDGNVNAMYVLHGNRYIYKSESTLDVATGTQKFGEFKAISGNKLQMESPASIAVSPDKKIVYVTGEAFKVSGLFAMERSFDGGNTFNKATVPSNVKGKGRTVRFASNSPEQRLVLEAGTTNAPSTFVITPDAATKQESVVATSLMNPSLDGRMVISSDSNKVRMYAPQLNQTGICITDIDLATGRSTITTVGAQFGFLDGRGVSGDTVIAANNALQKLYEIDSKNESNTTSMDYAAWLKNRSEISNYKPTPDDQSNEHIFGVDVYKDAQGREHTVVWGSYIGTDNVGHPFIGQFLRGKNPGVEPTALQLVALEQAKMAVVVQNDVDLVTYGGRTGYSVNIPGVGERFIPMNDDGTFDLTNAYYIDKGLGTIPPIPDPQPNKIYLPGNQISHIQN